MFLHILMSTFLKIFYDTAKYLEGPTGRVIKCVQVPNLS